MLRGDLQLSGNVELHQFFKERVFLICQQVVKANTAANKNLFHAGNLSQLTQQRNIVRVVGFHVFAGGGIQALPSAAGTLRQLLFAGRMAEVGGGAAHIVDIALEILVLYHQFGLSEDAFMAPGLDNSTLMEGQSAEGAGTEAAPIGYKAEFNFLDGRHATGFFVAGMPSALIGQGVDCVHFLSGQGLLRRILNDKFLSVGLCQTLGGEGVAVAVLDFEALGVLALVGFQLIKGGQCNGGQAFVQLGCFKYGAVDIGDIFGFHAGVQRVCQLHDGLFAHAIHQNIGLRIQQNGTLQTFRPVIVMPQSAQGRLNAADEDGDILVGLADQIAINDGGIVRTLAHNAAGGESVGLALVFRDGIMVDHGVHIAAGYQKTQPGTAVNVDGLGVLPVGLGNNTDAVSVAFQHTADDGVAEGWVIYIGIADDIYKIALAPASVDHILFADRKKAHSEPPKLICSSISFLHRKGKIKMHID